jgi:hypothetical protein
MGGGLMQLVAYGAQDIYLTGNPQITFFKIVYRRHTNFSLESIEQTFNGSADFGKKVTCTISRNGDLIHRTYLRVELPDVTVPETSAPNTSGSKVGFRWLDWVGHALIKSVELEIGGQRIDKHYAAWLHIWNELTQTAGHSLGYANMVGNTPDLTSLTEVTNGATSNAVVKGKILYIPLAFYFCRNPGLALPLIALQYHEVKLNLELEELKNLYWAGKYDAAAATPAWSTDLSAVSVDSLKSASLYVDYIYLDTDERRRFAQVSHEYLIEQLQFTGDESTSNTSNKVKLNFNHPCKELVWVVQPDDHVSDSKTAPVFGKQWFNFTDALDLSLQAGASFSTASGALAAGGATSVRLDFFAGGENPVKLAKLQLNGHDRFSERDGRYFNLVQPFQHHSNIPAKGINVYSFGLKPEEHQPSGTCNMSRIDNATLHLTLTDSTIKDSLNAQRTAKVKVFAVNYNVLRVMSGMGGLAYSN